MKNLVYRKLMILDFIKSCDDALSLNPDDTEALRLKGLLCDIAGEYDKAIAYFDRVLQSLPADSVTYFLKSSSHYEKGEYNLAKRDYMRALKIAESLKLSDDDINKAVILDDEDLRDIKTIIDHEKEKAVLRFLKAPGDQSQS